MTEKQTLTLDFLEKGIPELGTLHLDPSKPLPDDYSERFDAATIKVRGEFSPFFSNKELVAERAKTLEMAPWKVRFESIFGSITIGQFAPLFFILGFIAFLLINMFNSSESKEVPSSAIITGGVFGLLGVIVIVLNVIGHMNGTIRKLEKSGFIYGWQKPIYEERVAQWAKDRYGVTMDRQWATQQERLASDFINVAEKDGESVYCYVTDEGWVLGTIPGGELPVLTRQAQTV